MDQIGFAARSCWKGQFISAQRRYILRGVLLLEILLLRLSSCPELFYESYVTEYA